MPPKDAYACWTDSPVPHPWERIEDVACGYFDRLRDPKCATCHRCRKEGPEDQLRTLIANA